MNVHARMESKVWYTNCDLHNKIRSERLEMEVLRLLEKKTSKTLLRIVVLSFYETAQSYSSLYLRYLLLLFVSDTCSSHYH